MSNINWIEAIIGALIGFGIPYLYSSFLYLYRLTRRDYLIGEWFGYFATNAEGGKNFNYIEVNWKITRGFFKKYIIIESRDNNIKTYKGNIKKERDFIIILMKNNDTKENVFIKLFDPIALKDHVAFGLGLSLDFSGNPVSRPIIMAKNKKIEGNKLHKIVEDHIQVIRPYNILKARQ